MNKAHISELAMYWYFLSLQLDAGADSDEFLDELIETGSRLKAFLSCGRYTALNPFQASTSESVGVAVWLDDKGSIQAGELSEE
ncbi:hypothetical protein [Pedobacter sp. V48]|uniref:hypothetical protein n=1 Tax=Pedobacter sp. V48 TaxID=509635 RepID=UPI0003E454F0|nr:hypothetical protein [Pedobacter sp. V48]ETZ20854.1 hypothetical protein N824_29645 [Pedobacter sp. V48]